MRACVEELGENKSRVPAGGENDGGQARCTQESVDDAGGDISRIDLSNNKCIEEETGIGGENAGSDGDTFNHRAGDAGSCLRQDEDGDGDGDGCEEGLRRDRTQGSRELASADADEGPPGSSTVFCAHISLWPFGRIEITIDEKARAGGNKRQLETPSAARADQEGGQGKDDGEVKLEADGQKKLGLICRLVPCVCRWLRATGEQLRNSKELIGWLQQKGHSWTTMDVTSEFEKSLADVCNAEGTLPGCYDYLFVPGYLWNWFLSSQYFAESVATFNDHGLDAFFADQIDSSGTVDENADLLASIISRMHAARGKPIVLIGHSKGALDCLAAVAKYRTELAPLVRGIVCLQAPIGGSPIASDLVHGTSLMARIIHLAYRVVGANIESLKDLTHANRQRFYTQWGRHWPVNNVPVLCFSSTFKEGSSKANCTASKLLKAPEMYIGRLYGAVSDGVVTIQDSELPGTMVVRARGGLSHMSTVLDSPKGGIEMNGASAAVWQINAATIRTMLVASSAGRSGSRRFAGGVGGAVFAGKGLGRERGRAAALTTEDMSAYDMGLGEGLSTMRKVRSEDNMHIPGGLPRHVHVAEGLGGGGGMGGGGSGACMHGGQLESRIHYGRCSSDLGDVYAAQAALLRENNDDAGRSNNKEQQHHHHQQQPSMSPPPPRGPGHTPVKNLECAAGESEGNVVREHGATTRKLIRRGATMSGADMEFMSRQRSAGKVGARGWISEEVWMVDASMPRSLRQSRSTQRAMPVVTPKSFEVVDGNPPAPLADVNPPTPRKGIGARLGGALLEMMWFRRTPPCLPNKAG